MAKIKNTKNELKTQRDSLKRFERYLPTLQLKKQQLQIEIRTLKAEIRKKGQQVLELKVDLDKWVKLFTEPFDFTQYVHLASVRESVGNIAGVSIPVIQDIKIFRAMPDIYSTAPWIDDGINLLEKLVRLWVEMHVLKNQHERLNEELRITTQRVNLFEKIKIPESKENIRVIRIFLGDQQTAEVARAKIAKGKSLEREAAA